MGQSPGSFDPLDRMFITCLNSIWNTNTLVSDHSSLSLFNTLRTIGMDQLIFAQLEIARKLYARIDKALNYKQNITIDLLDCVDSLNKIKISTMYRNQSTGHSKEETKAIQEICQMAKRVQEIVGEL